LRRYGDGKKKKTRKRKDNAEGAELRGEEAVPDFASTASKKAPAKVGGRYICSHSRSRCGG
jgi:hypothetical protein